MNKKYINTLISIIILIFFFEIFDHSNIVSKSIINSSKIWFYNIIPSIFPIYIIVDLLIDYNIINYISKLFNPIMKYIFKMKKESSIVFILSMISGFPSSSKYINTLLDNKIINIHEANKLLMFTHFSNPLFLINSIGINFLHNKKIGIIILISHFFTNFIIGFINRNYYINYHSNNNLIRENKKSSFITTLTNSIYNTFKILILLYGIITIFMIVTSLINANINLNPLLNSILCGILEITNGIYFISIQNIPIIYKATIITFFISFGGLCIHLQILSILNNYKIDYWNFFKTRLVHAIVSSSIVFVILNFMR